MTDVVSPSDVSYPADGFALFPDRSVVALRVNGELKDLATVVDETDAVEPVTVSSPDGLAILRHSTAHVLAQAVQRIRPQSNLGIGPPIEDGFYYDFGVDEPFTPEDLKSIKKEMERIVRENQRFVRRVVTADEARHELADEPFKLELVDLAGGPGSGADAAEGASAEIGAGELTIYDNVTRDGATAWKDLCRGPHVPGTRMVGNGWDLTRVAAAYWRGSEKNPQLQRIYGTAWPSKDELRAYQERLAEAARRDHRKLGVELDLFSFPDEIGPGLSVFHPKGGIIRYEIERYMREQLLAHDYEVVNTPHITKGDLFMTSGHLQWYADGMYPPMKLDEVVDAEGNVTRQGQEYYLKPMNCPFHNLIFRSRGRSYRELPLRLSEFGSVYRYEKSGTLSGLTRVRGMTQDDTHIYVTPDQVEDELVRSLEFVLQTLRDYGLNDFYLELSTKEEGNPKFIGDDALWQQATETLRRVAEGSGLELVPDPGGAAFYGPKISVQARDAIGRTWQMSTIQLDFNQPERFELEYTGPDGEKHRPVMIHRALFGSIERFFAILLEHYAGAFPVWLAPVQVVGIPVADDYAPYLHEIVSRLRKAGVRAELDRSDDRMQKKIRTHTTQKVPLQLIAGEQDRAAGTVSFRFRDGSQANGVPVNEAVERILAAIANRTLVDTAEHLDAAGQLA
ncbi:threonine--tRNA ligase [Microbacterium arborescens]|uniref:threonine--tRNA ligase n=1 Tax=Microbacterium arborescens TaxID=33883 RepID=UPI00278B507B|nr:threonine--tRNA ligase [Microbacterium arborescens]MDQ1216466.1 threonyl-tRNA synthetase [Microbacterium arborescens]